RAALQAEVQDLTDKKRAAEEALRKKEQESAAKDAEITRKEAQIALKDAEYAQKANEATALAAFVEQSKKDVSDATRKLLDKLRDCNDRNTALEHRFATPPDKKLDPQKLP